MCAFVESFLHLRVPNARNETFLQRRLLEGLCSVRKCGRRLSLKLLERRQGITFRAATARHGRLELRGRDVAVAVRVQAVRRVRVLEVRGERDEAVARAADGGACEITFVRARFSSVRKKATPAFQRCKNQPKRASSRRDRETSDAGRVQSGQTPSGPGSVVWQSE